MACGCVWMDKEHHVKGYTEYNVVIFYSNDGRGGGDMQRVVIGLFCYMVWLFECLGFQNNPLKKVSFLNLRVYVGNVDKNSPPVEGKRVGGLCQNKMGPT